MGEPVTSAEGAVEGTAFGRARVTVNPSGLVIVAPGRRNAGVPLPAVLFGVPWFIGVIALSVWYLGWGDVPEGFWMRVLLWILALALTHNLGTLAYIAIWNAVYERIGIETLTIDREYIVVLREAGRFKREHRIGRKIIETAGVLPPDTRRPGRPRIEITSWRSAIGFGAGLDEREAEECARVIQTLFDRDEAARHAAEVARGRVHAHAGPVDGLADGDTEASAPEHVRTSVMQAYREALDDSKGPIRSGLGALVAVAKPGSRGARGASR